jgi:catalase
VGILIAKGSDKAAIDAIKSAAERESAKVILIAPSIGDVKLSDGSTMKIEAQLAGTPSVTVDAVVVLLAGNEADSLRKEGAALDFLRDAHAHLKAICLDEGGEALFGHAGLEKGEGVFRAEAIAEFIEGAKGRYWQREGKVRILP